jgi:hypothetical protein
MIPPKCGCPGGRQRSRIPCCLQPRRRASLLNSAALSTYSSIGLPLIGHAAASRRSSQGRSLAAACARHSPDRGRRGGLQRHHHAEHAPPQFCLGCEREKSCRHRDRESIPQLRGLRTPRSCGVVSLPAAAYARVMAKLLETNAVIAHEAIHRLSVSGLAPLDFLKEVAMRVGSVVRYDT